MLQYKREKNITLVKSSKMKNLPVPKYVCNRNKMYKQKLLREKKTVL